MAERREKKIVPPVPEIPEKEVEVITYICDICKKESKRRESFIHCTLCKRLVCYGTFSSCTQYDPRESGDYPNKYCPICYELKFVKYDKEFYDMEERHYTELENLDKKILQESLERKL